MADEPDPPRKFYGFKPREFERANPDLPAKESAPPPASAPDSGVAAYGSGPIDVRDLNRLAGTGQPLLSSTPVPSERNQVHAMLEQNHAVADAAGLNRVNPPTYKYRRRRRDYIVLMIGGNGFILVVYFAEIALGFQVQCLAAHMPFAFYGLLQHFLSNPIIFLLPTLCIAFFSAAMTWLLYGVLDDY